MGKEKGGGLLFPVNGWDVSASKLKTQTSVPPNGDVASKKSKKRKRGQESATQDSVTDQNVSELYQKLIDGKSAASASSLVRDVRSNAIDGSDSVKKHGGGKKIGGQEAGNSSVEGVKQAKTHARSPVHELDIGKSEAIPTEQQISKKKKRKKSKASQKEESEPKESGAGEDEVSRILDELSRDINESSPTKHGQDFEHKDPKPKEKRHSDELAGAKALTNGALQAEVGSQPLKLDKLPVKTGGEQGPLTAEERKKKKAEKRHAKRLAKRLKKDAEKDESSPANKGKEGLEMKVLDLKPTTPATIPTEQLSNGTTGTREGHPTNSSAQSEGKQAKSRKEKSKVPVPSQSGNSPNAIQSTKASLLETNSAAKTPIQQKMQEKLISSRFRIYNEQLYTTPSEAAAKVFREDPNGFETYHAGFRKQVQSWPKNPVTIFIDEIRKRALIRPERPQKGGRTQKSKGPSSLPPLVRQPHNGICRIADLGCGDATLASSLAGLVSNNKSRLSISSFDLERPKGPNTLLVTKADITNLAAAGITNPSFEIVICCLSLMSTNWVQIIDECARILVLGGEVWVAEVKSRFRRKDENNSNTKKRKVDSKSIGKGKKAAAQEEQEPDWRDELEDPPSSSKDDTDITAFVDVFSRRGLVLKGEVDQSNKMFVSMKFVKTGRPPPPTDSQKGAGEGGLSYAMKGVASNKKRKIGDVGSGDGVDMEKVMEEGKVLKPCVYKTR